MESSELYQARLKTLEKAISSFVKSLSLHPDHDDPILEDLIRNGQVQKFEYSVELLWKVIKQYMFEYEGVDEGAPKGVIKAFFRSGKINSILYEQLIAMIDLRNLFIHVYKEDKFENLYAFLPKHASALQEVLAILLKDKKK